MTSRIVKIGLVQMRMSDDVNTNVSRALAGVDEAARNGADIVCLPELFAWRYFPSARKSTQVPETIPGPVSRALSESARKNRVILVGGTIFEKAGASRYNTCLVFDEKGKTASTYRKVHVPQDEHYYEQDYFRPGDSYSVAETSRGNVGTLVCFDQWYPEPARVNKLMGAELLFYPTAIGRVKGIEEDEGDWKSAWESVQVGHAVSNSLVVCAVNRVGVEGATAFWGGSFVCDQFGKVLFRAGDEEGTHVVPCDLELGGRVEEGWGFLRNRRPDTYASLSR